MGIDHTWPRYEGIMTMASGVPICRTPHSDFSRDESAGRVIDHLVAKLKDIRTVVEAIECGDMFAKYSKGPCGKCTSCTTKAKLLSMLVKENDDAQI